eukprot:TRINITY_DN14396_c0_g1_i11.p1 TRINITY_DN14396_c0_g1~~TRINITY_DN14396_c0_g1_i11.p1  ORF type:complete len:262 (-),score=68.77 TRINITY_DN14396_c0_g1_i11:152-937(-)
MKKKTYRVAFTNYEIKNGHVEYFMKITDEESKDEFNVCDRYKTMREYWKSMTSKHGKVVPSKFPPKKFFGNREPGFIKQRMKDLEEYFNALLGDPNLAESPITQRYLAGRKVKGNKQAPPKIHYEELKAPVKSKSGSPASTQTISYAKLKQIVDIIVKSYIDIGLGDEPPNFEDAKKKTAEYASALSTTSNPADSVSRLLVLPKGRKQTGELSLEVVEGEKEWSKWLDGRMERVVRVIEEEGVGMYDDGESILSGFEMNFN